MKDAAYAAVADLLRRRAGLSFPPVRRDAAELGIRRAMVRAGVGDPDQYREHLERDADAFDDLLVELTVGETYFFREPEHFAFLRREVLPELRSRLGNNAWVRAWSAGCASGEEAYSLAILFEQEGLGTQSYVLATDVSRAALAKARQASYSPWSLRGEGAVIARPYLHAEDKRLVVSDKIRRRVTFDYLNLALDRYPSFAVGAWGMNLILCRNVLIYFDADAIRATARRLYETLAPGGWLFTASSDPPLGHDAPFETVATDGGIFYRHGVRPVAIALPVVVPAPPPLPPPVPPLLVVMPPAPPAVDPLVEARVAFAEGDYERAVERSRGLTADSARVLHVRSLANLDVAAAERTCAEALGRAPLSVELHYLHAVLLLNLRRDNEAVRALGRVLYLDRSLAVAHLTLGSIQQHGGDRDGARRAYRNARDLAAARPPDEPAPLADGETYGRLAETAAAQLLLVETSAEARP